MNTKQNGDYSKFGDADVSSKRRKSPQKEIMAESSNSAIKTVDGDYQMFEKNVNEHCLNSSFNDNEDSHLEYKSGLVINKSSRLTLLNKCCDDKYSCAKNLNDVTITPKPSLCSKGFENTFKLLQNQVQNNCQKTLSVMQSLNSSGVSSLSSIQELAEEPPTCFELELEALDRIRATLLSDTLKEKLDQQKSESRNCDDISTPLMSFLYNFAAKGLSKEVHKDAENVDIIEDNVNVNKDLIYHAAKSNDGRNCLRIVGRLLENKVLCGNRVSQMTRAYDDIEAVTRLLEEKEKDLELTVQIGKELLTQNNALESRINELESDLKASNDDRQQLAHELHKKNELIAVLTNDADDSEADTPTLSKSITFELLQKKVNALQNENKSLKMEASQLASETDEVEAQERQLMEDITAQLNNANSQFDNLNLDLERQREENRLQHEQIVSLTARLAEAEMRLHQLTQDNDEHVSLLHITKENQNALALELVEFKQRYQEVLALLQESQDLLRKQRKKTMPQARSSFISSNMGMLHPDSLHSELMESSMYSENSLDSGISGDGPHHRVYDRFGRLVTPSASQMNSSMFGSGIMGASTSSFGGLDAPYKRVFDTVRCASKNGIYSDSGNVSMTQIGAMSMSSTSGPRISAMAYGVHSSVSGLDVKTLSCESLVSQVEEESYPSQAVGVPGAPGAKDLEAALKRLTPAEVLARRAMLSYAPAGTYSYDDPPMNSNMPMGIRTPDSIMSTGSSGISSSTRMSGSSIQQHWRLPEKLQIVKPIEGSQTLHHWSRLATPTLSGLLEERPGVTIRGGRGLEELGMQTYTLSDVEEDVDLDDLPGKQFEASGCTYTYTTSVVMHPDDGIVNDLSFLSQSQMSSRMASATTSRQPSGPVTPRSGLSRKNSCSTFSVNMSLASVLNERGIKAVTPSALNTPAGPNFSPTVTPCNSPEGSPTRSKSPEPLFGLLLSGADLIRRKLGTNLERPNRNQHKQQQKIMLSRLERRALRSLKLVEQVESIGLENIITAQPSASGIVSRNTSPIAQLGSLKNLHTSANSIVDDIHFDRKQIKGVLQKGLTSPQSTTKSTNSDMELPMAKGAIKSSTKDSSPYSSDDDMGMTFKPINAYDSSLAAELSHNASHSATSIAATTSSSSATDMRAKHMQRQKSRRNLKNGIAPQQRPDLGTIGVGAPTTVRDDLGKITTSPPKAPATTTTGQYTGARAKALKESARKSDKNMELAAKSAAPKRQQQQQQQIQQERETPTLTQSFVGTVSSLLFGRKGGWL